MQTQTELFYHFQQNYLNIFFLQTVCCNPCVVPLPKIKIYFFLLSIFIDDLISTPKIITFLSTLLPNEKVPFLSNPISYPEYLYEYLKLPLH